MASVCSPRAAAAYPTASETGVCHSSAVEDRHLVERLRQIFGVELEELAGICITAEIPLSNELVNRFIAQRLAATQRVITAAHVEAQDDDNLSVELSMRGPRMLPSIRIAARIEQQPAFPHSAVMGLRWSVQGMGPLGLFAAPALTWLKALPPGIRADGDRMAVDVGAVMRAYGLDDLLRYVAKLQVHTRRGAFIIQVEMRIPRAGER